MPFMFQYLIRHFRKQCGCLSACFGFGVELLLEGARTHILHIYISAVDGCPSPLSAAFAVTTAVPATTANAASDTAAWSLTGDFVWLYPTSRQRGLSTLSTIADL